MSHSPEATQESQLVHDMRGNVRLGQLELELLDVRDRLRALHDESAALRLRSISYRDRAAEAESALSRISYISQSVHAVALADGVDRLISGANAQVDALTAEILALQGDVAIPFRVRGQV